jgi:hypothetical protein
LQLQGCSPLADVVHLHITAGGSGQPPHESYGGMI